jgi:hypothetical protein
MLVLSSELFAVTRIYFGKDDLGSNCSYKTDFKLGNEIEVEVDILQLQSPQAVRYPMTLSFLLEGDRLTAKPKGKDYNDFLLRLQRDNEDSSEFTSFEIINQDGVPVGKCANFDEGTSNKW